MPPAIAQIPPWAWAALAAVVGAGLAWLGWRWGPGRQIRALEVWQRETSLDLERLKRQVKKGWGDSGHKTTVRPSEPGPF